MFSQEYFNFIEEQILIEKFYCRRPQEHPPPVVLVPQVPVEPDIKIPIPLKMINGEFHINKLKKKIRQKNRKKLKENRKQKINLFLKGKDPISNTLNNSGSCNINPNGNKNDFFNYKNKSGQKSKIFIFQKECDGNNIFLKNSKINNSNKSFEFTNINYKLKKLSINDIIPRAYSTNNIRIKKNNLINIL